jgi:hypothetical protein
MAIMARVIVVWLDVVVVCNVWSFWRENIPDHRKREL